MNKNLFRIIVGSVIGIAIITILLFLLERTPLIYTAYAWIVFAIIAFAFSLGFWAKSHTNDYILRAPFPMVVSSYLVFSILIAVFFSLMEICKLFSIGFGWFCLIQFILLAVFVWRLLAIDAAREEIQKVEQNVKLSTISWKMIRVDMTNIAENISAEDKKVVAKTADAVRYADPMEHEAVADIVAKINEAVAALKDAAAEKNSDLIAKKCDEIERLVKERANKLMILK